MINLNIQKKLIVADSKADTKCLIMLPVLVRLLGRSTSIFLQQLHYWSTKPNMGIIHEGRHYIYNTYKKWGEDIGYSDKTIKRSVSLLKELGLIHVAKLSKDRYKHTNYYAIDYDMLNNFLKVHKKASTPDRKSPRIDVPMTRKNVPMTRKNVPIIIETNITSNIFTNYSKKSEVNEIKDFDAEKQPLSTKLLDVWNATVGKTTGQIAVLTKNRARFLVSGFKIKFNSCLEKWKKFCQRLTESDWMMGRIKKSFKATIDWVLKFDTMQRILEGQYGVRSINKEPEIEHRKIQEKDPLDNPLLRKSIKEIVGENEYLSWFQDAVIKTQDKSYILTFISKFQRDYIERMFKEKISNALKEYEIIFVTQR